MKATNGLGAFLLTANAAPHDWLTLTGGALVKACHWPLAPRSPAPIKKSSHSRPMARVCTRCRRWTMVREQLDVTVVR